MSDETSQGTQKKTPLLRQKEGLLAAGLACAASAFVFYKQKKTKPFKIAYFLTWPVLGAGIINYGMPTDDDMKQAIAKSHAHEKKQEQLDKSVVQRQMEELKHAAGKS
ncbi:hypothetical protein M9434_005813 [Picochlorum sp. BPE23]|nr:hypothetical protein M9434_005813 [Picochlorum sp. BPE23]